MDKDTQALVKAINELNHSLKKFIKVAEHTNQTMVDIGNRLFENEEK